MPNNTIIYEDQENKIPNHARSKRNAFKESRIAADIPHLNKNSHTATTINNGKRTVLGSLNVSNNVRVQPTRAAKQNVQVQDFSGSSNDENISCRQKTFATQSFEIHSDSSNGSTISFKSTTAVVKVKQIKKTTRLVKKDKESESIQDGIATLSQLHRDLPVSLPSSPIQDMSVCDDDCMLIESPVGQSCSISTSNATAEDVLATRNCDLYDVVEYREEIYTYLREAEVIHKPRPTYMMKQADITYSMRWILVDWLVEVSEEYNLHTETLYLAVSYIDRFLSHMSVKRDKLQLVGTTAMFIAAKYEEIYPPDVSQFAYITNNTYKVNQILRMEHLILKVLSFDMAVPTSYMFVSNFGKMNNTSEDTLHLAEFLAELSMLDGDPFLRYLPSLIAASALALANHTQGKPAWPEYMVKATKYSLEDLKECYINLKRAFSKVKEPSSHAIRDKYKTTKYESVASLTPRVGYPWDVGLV